MGLKSILDTRLGLYKTWQRGGRVPPPQTCRRLGMPKGPESVTLPEGKAEVRSGITRVTDSEGSREVLKALTLSCARTDLRVSAHVGQSLCP